MNSELTEITDISEQPQLRATSNSATDSGHDRIKPGVLLVAKSCRVPCRRRINRSESFRGWILYDGACSACAGSVTRFERLFRRRGFHFAPLQTEWVTRQLRLEPGAPLEEMHVLTTEGEDIAGADAVLFLARQIWWAWPVAASAKIPGMRQLLDRSYRWIAAHRGCDHGTSEVDMLRRAGSSRLLGSPTARARFLEADWKTFLLETLPAWMALIGLPISVLPLRDRLHPWQFMWLMTAAIYFGCKWLTAWRAQKPNIPLKLAPMLGYFFAWPGMDAEKFVGNAEPARTVCVPMPSRRDAREHVPPIAKICLGAVLLFGIARLAPQPVLAGWIGMIGMILILHFGMFRLLAIGWRKAGIDVEPIMNAPLRSKTVSEFWGRRWNSAFNRLVFEFVSRPIIRRLGGRSSCDIPCRSPRISTLRFGVAIATLTAFLFSGLIHELVISLPAGAGYGLPTGYFLLQGNGILLERLFPQIRGRTFTILITAVPAFWLFNPAFVHNVILPFMKAIGAF